MTIHQLEYFCAVAEEGSVSAAARKLHMAQPPVSRQLTLLENELQVKLFVRRSKGVAITEAGQQLYDQSRQLLERMGQLADSMRNLGSGDSGVLKLGMLYSTVTCATEYIRSYHRQYPLVELQIRLGTPQELMEALNRGALHALFLRSGARRPAGAAERVVHEDRLELVMTAQTDPAPDCDCIPLERLHGAPLCMLRSDDLWRYDEKLLRECARRGISPKVVCRCYDTPMIMQMIQSGFGAGFLPGSIVGASRSSEVYSKPVQGLSERSRTVLTWKNDRRCVGCVERFVRMPFPQRA